MWIIVAVIVFFLFARALNNAGKKGRSSWTAEDDLTCQLDEVKVTLLEVEGENNHLGMTAINTLRIFMQCIVDKV